MSLPVLSEGRTRLLKLHLEPFLLMGATTEESLLPRPLHSRFLIRERLDFYSVEELAEIAVNEGAALGLQIAPVAARALAAGSRGTPRILLGHLQRARDLAQVMNLNGARTFISREVALEALRSQGIDGSGLCPMDRKILQVLVERGGPLGLRTLSDLTGENPRTLVEVYEPYLIRAGFLARTHRGRQATEKARRLFLRRAG